MRSVPTHIVFNVHVASKCKVMQIGKTRPTVATNRVNFSLSSEVNKISKGNKQGQLLRMQKIKIKNGRYKWNRSYM